MGEELTGADASSEELGEETGVLPVDASFEDDDPAPKSRKSSSEDDSVARAIDKVLGPEDATDKPQKDSKSGRGSKSEKDGKTEKGDPASHDTDSEKTDSGDPEDDPSPSDDDSDAPEDATGDPEDRDLKKTEKPRRTAFKDAPQRFDDVAKGEWESVPESVRGAIHRALRETEQGIEKHREASQAFSEVAEFDQMARQSGTTLKQALTNYVQLEQMLRHSPMAGLEQVVTNLGLKDNTGRSLTFKDLAEAYLRRTPVENQNATLQAQMAMMQQQQQQQTQRQAEFERRQYVSDLRQRAESEYPRFNELRATMLGLVQSGEVRGSDDRDTMRLAYQRAEEMFPTNAGHTGEAVAQTRTRPTNPAGQKSVSGAPKGVTQTTNSRPKTIEEAVDEALRRAGL